MIETQFCFFIRYLFFFSVSSFRRYSELSTPFLSFFFISNRHRKQTFSALCRRNTLVKIEISLTHNLWLKFCRGPAWINQIPVEIFTTFQCHSNHFGCCFISFHFPSLSLSFTLVWFGVFLVYKWVRKSYVKMLIKLWMRMAACVCRRVFIDIYIYVLFHPIRFVESTR